MADYRDVERKPRVIIAIRVSSEKQVTDGYGYRAQAERLPRLVADAGWVIAKRPDGSPAIYDEGFASTTAADPAAMSLEHRPVMQALLAELETTQPDYLVCRQLDRLYRDHFEHAYMVKMLKAAGVKGFATAPTLEQLDPRGIEDPRDEAMAGIEAIFANLQKADLKIKLMMGRAQRARDGKPNGGPAPFGYRRPAKRAPFVIRDDEAETYRLMVQLVAEHGWGPAKIAHELVKRGCLTRSGDTAWTATTVRRILLSRAQCGYVRTTGADGDGAESWVKAQKPEDRQPPIITEEAWLAMRAVLDSRRSESGHNQRRHALAGLLRCSACGKSLKAHPDSRRARDGRKYYNYSCRVYNSGCTAGYSISESKALRELGVWVDAQLAATDAEGWRDDLTTAQLDIRGAQDRVESLSRALRQASRKRERAYTLWVEAEEADEAVAKAEHQRRRARVEEIEAQLNDAQDQLEAIRSAASAPNVSIQELREVLDGWREFPDNEKRMALSAVMDYAILGPATASPRLTVVPFGSGQKPGRGRRRQQLGHAT